MLWRVDYRGACCKVRTVGWFDTRKKARGFIGKWAALPCWIVRDARPERHPEWPTA